MASVVLRTMTTTSSPPDGLPVKRWTSSRASSYSAVARRDLYPAPRWTLEYHGRNSATRSATDASAGVDAAQSRSR